jgi:YidC/Oxa1 family membrane protein insertase
MEERRLLIAVALSLLVLTAYQMLFAPRPAPAPAPGAAASPAGAASPSPAAPPSPLASPAPARPAGAAAAAKASAVKGARGAAPAPAPAVQDERERRVEVATPDLVAAFSNRGAALVSWRLARYEDARGRPEEMVFATSGGPRPLALETGDVALDAQLREALYKPSAETLEVRPGLRGEIRFEYAEGDVRAEKALRFPAPGYCVEVQASVLRAGQALPVKVLWGPGVGNPTAGEMEVQGYQAPQAVFLGIQGVERLPPDTLGAGRMLGSVRWAGVESMFFAALWVPQGAPAELRAVPLPAGEDGKARIGPQAAVTLLPGQTVLLYVGPKDHDLLAGLGHDLQRVVPVGDWIGPIVVPLMKLMRWVHGGVGNYGWAIVVLTVLINLAMAPLRHYSIANGLKMAKLAPEMRVIQERYRKVPLLDPKRQDMQQEISELYARHGMSMGTQMAVGCLPLLLTMPFLIAFYRVLQVAIELRGASFMWIPDLSQKDPYFLTPILMGASMFWMQKMVPTGMDPAQQRIMLIMPVVLSGMFLWAPAGLNLYWLASNICSIVQQGITLHILRARDAAAAPKKERKRA